MIKIFLDANIYFTAARSPSGGSSFVLEFVKKGKLKLFITTHVLKEAERNLRLKEDLRVLLRHYENLELAKPRIVKIEKDALVLAGAQKAKVNYLVTLDRKHFFTKEVGLAKLPFQIVTPGQLIEKLATLI